MAAGASKNVRHTVVALVEDKPGVLNRVVSLFRRRGFNIVSLTVGPSEMPGLSRLTIVVGGDTVSVEQVVKQLYKLIEVIKVSDDEATIHARRLAAEEGLLVGISSGAACCAALKVAKSLGKGHVVVTIFADKGEHYLSTDLFSDRRWMKNSNS